MIKLVPDWAINSQEFWEAITRRNSLLIKLRYFAAISLLLALYFAQNILLLNLSDKQFISILLIGLFIITYNFLIHLLRYRAGYGDAKFNKMHLSLLQMVLDLIMLTVLVYYTGGIDSPLYLFYIFHMIIGSLILPGYLIYSICIVVIIVYGIIIFSQQLNLSHNHAIHSLYLNGVEQHTWSYVTVIFSIFAVMMLISVLLANKIAKQLYLREQELYESLKKLEEQETEKQNYIIGIVHELKSPIVAVQSLLDLIVNNYLGPVSDPVREKLGRARKRTEDSLTMINNILRISRLKLLKMTSSEDINIKEIIDSVIEKAVDIIQNKKILYSFIDERNNLRSIKGDRVLLELALSNIVSNSIKYTPKTGKLLIKLVDDEEYLIIKICDNGVGIPKNELEKVKGQFYRASNIKNKDYDGTGMGLSLVSEIVLKMNGTIELQSPSEIADENNPGTCVVFKIPYEKVIEVKPIDKIISKANLKI